jgi:hypothetical protein
MYIGLCQLKSLHPNITWSEVFLCPSFDNQRWKRFRSPPNDARSYSLAYGIGMFGITMAKPGTTLRYSSDINGLRDKTDRIIIKSFKQTINLIKE